jgi:hypothetical protein
MNTTNKTLLNRADSLANEYNKAISGADRDKIKAEWYKEISRVAELIETHNTFSEKKLKSKSKIKKSVLKALKA